MVKTVAADAEGSDLTVRFTDFPRYYNGTEIVYTVTETPTEATDSLDAWTVSGGTLSAVNDINTGLLEGYETTFTNTPKGAEVEDELTLNILKKDKMGDGPLKDAVFTITKKGDSDTETDITTGDDGIASYTITSPGTYYVVEKTAPEGYELDSTRYEFVVDKNLEKIELRQDTWTKLWELLFNKLDNPFVQDATNEKLYTLTLVNTSKVSEIAVNKLWKDSNNQDGTRVKTIAYTLVAKDSAGDVITSDLGITDATKSMTRIDITEADEAVAGTMSWTNLPMYYNGSKVKYTITETAPNGYTVSYDANENLELSDTATTTVNATNTYDALKTKVTVNKVWEDEENQDGKRPTSVEVKLYKVVGNARTLVDTKTVSGDTWTYEWTELPVKENGTTIKYYVVETPVTDYTIKANSDNGYDKRKDAVAGDTGTFTITNVHEIEKADIKVVKVWDDNNDQDGKRSLVNASVQLESKAANETDWTAIDGKTATVSTSDGEVVTWSELPLYKDGELINYRVVETIGQANSEYTKSGDNTSLTLTKDGETVVTITNSYEPIEGYIRVTKTWDDKDNVYGERKVTKVHLYKTVDGVTKHVETLSGSEIIETTDGYETMFGPLPAYEGGKLIKYTIVEEDVNGYKTTITQNGIDGVELTRANTATAPAEIGVTNAHPEEVEITFTKTWDDNNNADNTRPTLGEFASYITLLAGSEDVTVANANKLTTSESGNTYTLTWKRLARKTDGDTPTDIEYKVKETLPRILEDIYVPSSTEAIAVTWDANHEKGTAAITNSSKTYLEVEKVWADNNNQDGKRPGSVTVQLLADGTEVDGKTLTLEEANKWSGKFTELPISDNGTVINYTVKEVTVPEGYTSASSISIENHKATITNTYTPGVVAVTAEKVWDETSENEAGVGTTYRRNVNFHLIGYKGDNEIGYIAEVKTIAADASGEDLKVTWYDLPKMLEGEELTWKLYEDAIPGYRTLIEKDGNNFTVTNIFNEPSTEVEAKKVWEDNDNQDGKRPDNVTLQLLQSVNGGDFEVVADADEKVVTGDETENVKWENLPTTKLVDVMKDNPEYDADAAQAAADADEEYNVPEKILDYTEEQAIIYLVKEKEVPTGYEAVVIVNEEGVFEVHNIHETEVTSITVNKIWIDEEDDGGFRPDHIELTLTYGGVDYEAIVLDPWTYTFENLPKYKDGNEIEYSEEDLVEKHVPEYTTVVVKNNDGSFTITNTLNEQPTITVKAKKVWDHGDNLNPASETVFHLYGNGHLVSSKEITSDTLEVVWDNLKNVDVNGSPIIYDVVEDDVAHYTLSSTREVSDDGYLIEFTITNTYTPEAYPIVTYVDPLAEASDMIMKATRYPSGDDATNEANTKAQKPADPSHDGYKFEGWDVDYDPVSGYVLVAKYTPVKKTVTFIDPEAEDPIIKSESTSDTSSVEKPGDPSHENRIFKGWLEAYDADGNVVYIAQYEVICPDTPECKPSGSCVCPACPSGPGRLVPNTSTIH